MCVCIGARLRVYVSAFLINSVNVTIITILMYLGESAREEELRTLALKRGVGFCVPDENFSARGRGRRELDRKEEYRLQRQHLGYAD